MSECRIFIIRHTQTIGNIEKRLTGRCDYEITPEGEEYIKLLTEELKDIKFDEIYSSTSERAKKTVMPLAKVNNKTIIENQNLCEMYFGVYDGWTWEEVNKVNPNIKETQILINEIVGIPEQESMEGVAERVYSYIESIAKKSGDKTILMASHGVAIEAFLRKIVGIPFSEEREKFCQHNTAINEVVYENGKFSILRLADMKHIQQKEHNDEQR